ncbi:MAG: glycosyltransferase family 61 protein, partial [Hymenobacter sp.]
KEYTVEANFPAPDLYHPTLPANAAFFPVETIQRFLAPVYFSAHRVYRLHNVHVTWDGAVFQNLRLFVPSIVQSQFASRFQDTLMLRQWVGEKVRETHVCVAVCHDQWSVENYYHWLIDTLPRLLVLRQTHPGAILLLPQPLPPKQLPDYITCTVTALGFTQYLPLTTRQLLYADCVVLPELTAAPLTQNLALVIQIQAELRAALKFSPVTATRKVYAARATGGVRSLVNEAVVDELLKEFGFEKVYFERLSFLEQVQLMHETAVFLGVHGAGMTNMLFLPSSASVIELLNETHGDLCYFRLASCLGLAYFWVPCAGTNQELANQADMVVNTELLMQAIQLALGQQ